MRGIAQILLGAWRALIEERPFSLRYLKLFEGNVGIRGLAYWHPIGAYFWPSDATNCYEANYYKYVTFLKMSESHIPISEGS